MNSGYPHAYTSATSNIIEIVTHNNPHQTYMPRDETLEILRLLNKKIDVLEKEIEELKKKRRGLR